MKISDDYILDYLDGSLSAEANSEIERRRSNDPELDERIQSYDDLGQLLHKSLLKTAPADIETCIIQRLEMRSRESISSMPTIELGTVLSAALVVSMLMSISFMYQYYVSGRLHHEWMSIGIAIVSVLCIVGVIDQVRIYLKIRKHINNIVSQ